MSPEIKRARTSKGWAKHERDRKAAERKSTPVITSIVPPEKPEDPAVIHWKAMQTAVTINFKEDKSMLSLFNEKVEFFRRFASGRRTVTLNLDRKDYDNLVEEYLGADSPLENSEFWDKVSPILKVITAETAKIKRR